MVAFAMKYTTQQTTQRNHLFTYPLLIHGTVKQIRINSLSNRDSTEYFGAVSLTGCRCLRPSLCSTILQRMPQRRFATCGQAVIRSSVLKWVKNQMGSLFHRNNTGRSISSLRRPYIRSTKAFIWAVQAFKISSPAKRLVQL